MQEQITISGQVFTVPIRYGEGYTLNENEARVLNHAYHYSLRNNFAGRVKKGLAIGKSVELLQSELDEYAESYQLGVDVRTRPGRDPIMAEAVQLAKAMAKAELVRKGKKPKDLSGKELNKAARKLIENTPAIVKLAQKRVNEITAIAAGDLKSLVAELG